MTDLHSSRVVTLGPDPPLSAAFRLYPGPPSQPTTSRHNPNGPALNFEQLRPMLLGGARGPIPGARLSGGPNGQRRAQSINSANHPPRKQSGRGTSVRAQSPTFLPAILPISFDGDRSRSLSFINTLEQLLQYNQDSFKDEPASIEWAALHLSWKAALWFEQLKSVNHVATQTWEEFRAAFADAFIPPIDRLGQVDQLLQLRQTSTVQKYNVAFSTIIGKLDATEGTLTKDVYLRGLSREVYAELQSGFGDLDGDGTSRTIAQLAQMAHRIDQRLRSEGNTPRPSSLDPLLSSLPGQVSGISDPASVPTSVPTSRPASLPASLPATPATPPSKPSSHSTPAPTQPKSIPPPPADAGEGRDKHRRQIREYRMRYGLCLYCGDSEHILDNCHVRRASETGNADRGKPIPPPPENIGQPREEFRRQVREYRQRYHLCNYCGISGHELDDCPDRPLRSQSRNPEDREKEVEKEKDTTAEILQRIQAVLGNMTVDPGKRRSEGRRLKSSSEDKESVGKESDD